MVRTRFAPSPTGYLHIGGVRTALFNWLFARRHGGQFILRIDDTDQQRNVEAALQPILDGFRWLGLDWDEGPDIGGPHAPYYQSARADRHREAVEQLLANGFAYRDYARPEEIQAERALAEAEKRSFQYSRRWMAENDAQAARFETAGRHAVVRLKMPREGQCEFHDLVRGPMNIAWEQEQDHVIRRTDGSCLYHLASVVDDHDYEITHVIRAVEHLSNTPRQIFIAQGLGYPLPQFAHLPYVAEPGSSTKLSKRKLTKYLKHPDFKNLYEHGVHIARQIGYSTEADTFNPVLVDFYRAVGYIPDALVNYLLLLGWSLDDNTESFTRKEMVRSFTLDRVNKSAASFDPAKLWAFEHRQMNVLPIEAKLALTLPFLRQAGWTRTDLEPDLDDLVRAILSAAGDRIKTAGDILDYPEFFVTDDQLEMDPKAFAKCLGKTGAVELLNQFRDRLAQVEPFDAAATESTLRAFVENQGIKIGGVIHALRVAVTGRAVGLGMFDCLAILGKERVLNRIDRALAFAKQRPS